MDLQSIYASYWNVTPIFAAGNSEGAKKGWTNRYSKGQVVGFDGQSADGATSGFFQVEIIHPHSNEGLVGHTEGSGKNARMYRKDGMSHIPTATVKNTRSGKVFEAFHHSLR